MKIPEYAKLKLLDIPEEVICEYNLQDITTEDVWVYLRVVQGMYGLPQSGASNKDKLQQRLNIEDYLTKHDEPSHHMEIRPEILTSYKTLMNLRSHQKHGLQECVTVSTEQ